MAVIAAATSTQLNSTIVEFPYIAQMNCEKAVSISGIPMIVYLTHKDDNLWMYVRPNMHMAFYPLTFRVKGTLLNAKHNATKHSVNVDHEFDYSDKLYYGAKLVPKGDTVPVVDGKIRILVRLVGVVYNAVLVLGVAHAALASAGTSTLATVVATMTDELKTVRAQLEEATTKMNATPEVVVVPASPLKRKAEVDVGLDSVDALISRRNPEELRRKLTELESKVQRVRAALNDTETCVICMDKKRAAVFMPCSHLACCVECSSTVTTCCICRTPVTSVNVPKMA